MADVVHVLLKPAICLSDLYPSTLAARITSVMSVIGHRWQPTELCSPRITPRQEHWVDLSFYSVHESKKEVEKLEVQLC